MIHANRTLFAIALAGILLATVVAWVAVNQIYSESGLEVVSVEPLKEDKYTEATEVGQGDSSLRYARNLFGAPENEEPAQRQQPTEEKEVVTRSSLDQSITIQGVVVHSDRTRSSAIIKTGEGPPDLFRIGDVVHDGATLVAISRSQIILSEGGSTRVNIPIERYASGPPESSPSNGVASHRSSTSEFDLDGSGTARDVSSARVSRAAYSNERPPGNTSAGEVIQDGFFEGARETDSGLLITGAAAAGRALGLRSGDVITAVDGQPVTGIQSAAEIMRQVESDSVLLTFERRGQEFTVRRQL